MFLASCGVETRDGGAAGGATATPGKGAAGGGGGTLEFWAFSEDRIAPVKELIKTDTWKSAHPNVEINFRVFPYEQMHNKLLSALVAGQGAPDIADVEISRFAQFIKGDRIPFVPLKDRIGSDLEKLITPAATDPWSWDGQIYGVGNELNTTLFAYRKDLMDELGIQTPFETWEQVIEAGKQVTQGDRHMFAIHDIAFGDWYMMAQHAGTTLFDEQGNYIGDSPKSVEALQFLHDLVYKHEIGAIAPADAQNDWFGPQYWAAFEAERFAAVWGPPWHIGRLQSRAENLSGKWTVQPFPTGIGDSRPTANFGGTGHCITEQSEHADVAWELIKMVDLTTEGALKAFELGTVFPSFKPAYDEPALNEPNEYFGGVKLGEVYASVAPELIPFRQSPVWPDATEALVRVAITPVMQDKKDAQTALTELGAEIERLQK